MNDELFYAIMTIGEFVAIPSLYLLGGIIIYGVYVYIKDLGPREL